MNVPSKKCSRCKCIRKITDFTRKGNIYKSCNACSISKSKKNLNNNSTENIEFQNQNFCDIFFATIDTSKLNEEQHDYLLSLNNDWIKMQEQMKNKIIKLWQWVKEENEAY